MSLRATLAFIALAWLTLVAAVCAVMVRTFRRWENEWADAEAIEDAEDIVQRSVERNYQ